MSHSGNNPSRRLKSLQKLHNKEGGGGEQFYNPSVFRYKCVGYLNLNSDDKGSYGTCRGFQSRMERVANMVPDTREGAIKKFLDASNDLGTYVDSDESSDQKVKEIYTSRTMIYKEDDNDKYSSTAPRIQPAKSSPFPEDELINKTEWSCWGSTSVHYLVLEPIRKQVRRGVPKQQQQQQQQQQGKTTTTPGDTNDKADEIYDALTQQLRNFDKNFDNQFDNNDTDESSNQKAGEQDNDKEQNSGKKKKKKRRNSAKEVAEAFAKKQKEVVAKVAAKSSSIDYKNNVSAITPENIGLSIRKIDSSVGHFTVTDIGSIRICVETSASLIGDNNSSSRNNNRKTRSNNNSNPLDNKKDSSQQLAANKNSNSSDPGQGQNETDAPQEEERKLTTDLKKFYDFTVKVGHQMKYNCNEIKEAVKDDFPGRTYRFGSKVVNRFQKTSEQTFTYMGKILNSWWKSM